MKKVLLAASVCFALSAHADTTVIESQAVNNGVVKCATPLAEMGDYIIGDKSHATHSTWNSSDPDNRLYASLSSKGYSDGDSHVTVIAAPTSSGKCDTTYIETFALAKSCMLTREEVFSDWAYVGTMNEKTSILKNENDTVNIYLSSQGTNDNICLVSKREVIYQ